MNTAINRIFRKPLKNKISNKVDFSAILMVYKSESGAWRGFAHPYNVTTESDNRDKTIASLKEQVEAYEEGLRKYHNPEHLRSVRLSSEEDDQMFGRLLLSGDLYKTLVNEGSISESDYYAETQRVQAKGI